MPRRPVSWEKIKGYRTRLWITLLCVRSHLQRAIYITLRYPPWKFHAIARTYGNYNAHLQQLNDNEKDVFPRAEELVPMGARVNGYQICVEPILFSRFVSRGRADENFPLGILRENCSLTRIFILRIVAHLKSDVHFIIRMLVFFIIFAYRFFFFDRTTEGT